MSDQQMLKWADVYMRTSRNGNTYPTAYLGGLKLLIFPVHDPQDDGPSHTAFLAPPPPRQERPPAHDARRGEQTDQALRDRASQWRPEASRSSRSAGAAVLEAAGRGSEFSVEPIPERGDDLPF